MNVTTLPVALLKPHPRNYRGHPDDQLAHIAESIKQNGFYRHVVVAKDNVILAGHGVVSAAKKLGMESVPVVLLDLDSNDPKALKILTGDNEMSRLGEVDDRALSELLKDIKEIDSLLGTGFDEVMLANMVMITRPASEIADFDAAAEWVGMPEYDAGGTKLQLLIAFESKEDRDAFIAKAEMKPGNITKRGADGKLWSARWPADTNEDAFSLRFKKGEEGK